jgi:catechol 2,3-dioxygenase-like lactoylglutathione lyase family enzyme
MSFTVTRVIPTLRMFDIAKAREFYLDYLGFTVDFEHRFHDDAPLYMGISRDGLVLHLSEHHGDGSPGVHVTIEISGVDELHRELQGKKYRYMNPGIEATEWGTRDLGVIDPVGNRLTFSERITKSS